MGEPPSTLFWVAEPMQDNLPSRFVLPAPSFADTDTRCGRYRRCLHLPGVSIISRSCSRNDTNVDFGRTFPV